MHWFETLTRRTCLILFSLLIVFLAVHSLFFTAEMKSNETVDYLADSVWVHLLVVGALMLLALYLRRRGWRLSEKAEKRFIWLLALLAAASSTLCALLSKSLPIFDQQLCISAANALAAGNFENSLQGYYLNYYPFQLPWVLFLSLFSQLGSPENPLVYQLLNVPANLLSIWALAECGALLFHRRGIRLLTWMGALAFLPLVFYVPFAYSNLVGLSLMLLGARNLLLYGREHKTRHLLGVVLCFTLAALLKKNFTIASVAAFLVLLLDALGRKRVRPFLAAALLMAASLGGNQVLFKLVHARAGADLTQGFPMSSFILLGLQEEEGRIPGWYNNSGYILYEKAGFSTAVADEMAKEGIRERLAVFAADPGYTVSFFYRKMISQWDEPSFQSLWVNEMARNPQRGALALSLYEHGKAGQAALWWMNQYHSILLLGAALWLLFCPKRESIGLLFFPLCLVGGSLFHLVWEAKGQYTLFYFFCLIPYAVMGYRAAVQRLDSVLPKKVLGAKGAGSSR